MSTQAKFDTVKVAIGICTYHRPDGLRSALAAIGSQSLSLIADAQVIVVIVDNSPDGSAGNIARERTLSGRFSTYHIHEPRKGLSLARNAAIDAAHGAGATHLAFVDDDEMPEAGWLEALLVRLTAAGSAAVIGPVIPVFEEPPSRWLPVSAYAARRPHNGGLVDDAYTGNSMLELSPIISLGLEFDPRFNDSGGEDTAFFRALRRSGHTIAWAEDAAVYELVTKERMKKSWLLKRWLSTGAREARLDSLEQSRLPSIVRNLARGIVRVVAGAGRIAGAIICRPWQKPETVLLSFYTACRGIGFICAALGTRQTQYTGPHYR